MTVSGVREFDYQGNADSALDLGRLLAGDGSIRNIVVIDENGAAHKLGATAIGIIAHTTKHHFSPRSGRQHVPAFQFPALANRISTYPISNHTDLIAFLEERSAWPPVEFEEADAGAGAAAPPIHHPPVASETGDLLTHYARIVGGGHRDEGLFRIAAFMNALVAIKVARNPSQVTAFALVILTVCIASMKHFINTGRAYT